MLTYCFVPVHLPFEAAGPALIESLGSCQDFANIAEAHGRDTLRGMGLMNGTAADPVHFEYRNPMVGAAQITVPVSCSSVRRSLMAMEADLTLSKLGPSMCHLSIRSSSSGRKTRSLVDDRVFQMVVEVAMEGFLEDLVDALTSVAHSRHLVPG